MPKTERRKKDKRSIHEDTMRRTMFKPKSEYFILNQNYLNSYKEKKAKLLDKEWMK